MALGTNKRHTISVVEKDVLRGHLAHRSNRAALRKCSAEIVWRNRTCGFSPDRAARQAGTRGDPICQRRFPDVRTAGVPMSHGASLKLQMRGSFAVPHHV